MKLLPFKEFHASKRYSRDLTNKNSREQFSRLAGVMRVMEREYEKAYPGRELPHVECNEELNTNTERITDNREDQFRIVATCFLKRDDQFGESIDLLTLEAKLVNVKISSLYNNMKQSQEKRNLRVAKRQRVQE
jgi:hypothetical protein